MKLSQQSKILREDIKEAEPWADVILTSLNTLIQNFYNLCNKNIDDDNIRCQIKELTFTTLPTYPTDFEAIKFVNTMKVKASGCMIQQCINKNTTKGVSTANPGWDEVNGTVVINLVLGLLPSTTYIIRFRLT